MDGTYAPQSPDLSFLSGLDQQADGAASRPHEMTPLSNNQSQQQFYYPPIPALPTTHNQFTAEFYQVPSYTAHYHQQQYSTVPTSYYQAPATSFDNKPFSATNTAGLDPGNNSNYSAASGPAMAQQAASSSSGHELGPSLAIDIKTKFPVARIKRIMQADEEVGKVAQVTPVAVSKALELFMISLCTKSASIARNASSKRITAAHLKAAIEADDQFDFLNEITSKVPAPQEAEAATGEKKGRSKAKHTETKSEGDSEEGEKKPKTRGRKKKSEGD